jgi:hypothetical protein
MVNPFQDVNWKPEKKDLQTFAKSLMIGFPILAVVFSLISFVAGHGVRVWPLWMGGIGFTVGLAAFFVPQPFRPLYVVWYGLACSIGIVVSNVLLALLYFLAFTPYGLVMKAIGRDRLGMKPAPGATTFWQKCGPMPPKASYLRQF